MYGWWRPRIVFPDWLIAAPVATQTFALEHERQHLAVRDPQVLAGATLLFALVPWNLPLLWMLRRLRFAMEVDCDARVVRAGVVGGSLTKTRGDEEFIRSVGDFPELPADTMPVATPGAKRAAEILRDKERAEISDASADPKTYAKIVQLALREDRFRRAVFSQHYKKSA